MRMGYRDKAILGVAAIAVIALGNLVALQASTVERKASGVRSGMTFAEVSRQLDGWAMINAHPQGRGTQNRELPGPEYFGYSGKVYVLTPIEEGGHETDRRKISREEFERRLEMLLSDGEAWTVFFNFRVIGPDSGVLVRFNGRGQVAEGR